MSSPIEVVRIATRGTLSEESLLPERATQWLSALSPAHSVLCQRLQDFTANDSRLDSDRRLLLITGPNMGGKSTYMRQTALITILARMGAPIPAPCRPAR